jgi:hypothetical protein
MAYIFYKGTSLSDRIMGDDHHQKGQHTDDACFSSLL